MINWRLFLQTFVTLIILWYLTKIIPLQNVYQAILHSELIWIIAALAFILISLFSMSVRMNIMMKQQKLKISLWNIFRIRLISFYYKLFIPGGTFANIGILFYKFSQINNDQKTEIISSIMFDRLLATVGLCFVGLICLFITKPELPFLLISLITLIFSSLLIIIFILSNKKISNIIGNYLRNNENKLTLKFLKLLNSVKEFQKLTVLNLIYLIMLSILPHIFGVIAFTAISCSMGLELTLLDWGWIRSVVILGTMLPISLAGIGIRDGILIYILSLYSVTADSAWALSILLLAVTTLWPAFLGLALEIKSFGNKITSS